MNDRNRKPRCSPALVDRMLADPAGRPRHEAPSHLHARIVERVRDDMRQGSLPTPSRAPLSAHLWSILGGALGVAVVAGAWLFALQVWNVQSPPPPAPADVVATERAPLAVVASIDDRLFEESRAAAGRLATAVSATYRRELDAVTTEAKQAAAKAATYTRWMRTTPADESPVEPSSEF